MAVRLRALASILLLAACGDDAPKSTLDAAPADDAGSDAATDCRPPAAADRTRYVVVSHPYDAAGMAAGTYEVLQLATTGELTRFSPPRLFTMGRASFGTIAFTPDGHLGMVPTDRGKLAVFRLDDDGMPTVVAENFSGAFYASDVVVAPDGRSAFVVDGNVAANGGGISVISIGCDDAIADLGQTIPADFPGAFLLGPESGQAVIASRGVFGTSPAGDDVHVVLFDGDPPGRLGGSDVFGDDDAIIGGAALSHDGRSILLGDTNGYRIGVATLDPATSAITKQAPIAPFPDPQGIVASPFGDVAIATSTLDGDKIHVLDRGGAGNTWRDAGEVAYQGARPQLPGDLVQIARGALAGRVFVSENVSVRQLQFKPDGSVEDVASLGFGDGLDNVLGAIGVTP